jgi:hypothetical protein
MAQLGISQELPTLTTGQADDLKIERSIPAFGYPDALFWMGSPTTTRSRLNG